MSRTDSKFTFGNILLGLLLLATVVVIGLIVLVYFQLTRPTQRGTGQTAAIEAPAKQPVEIISPDGKTVRTDAAGSQPQSAQASAAAQQQQEADAAAAALNTQTANAPINSSALTGGAAVPRKPRPRKPRPPKENTEYGSNGEPSARSSKYRQRNHNADSGEIPLEPTNRAPRESRRERPLVPRNSERREARNDHEGERPLTPVKPKRQSKQPSEAIDNLF